MKYYKTRCVTLEFEYQRREKPVVQLTITAIEPRDSATSYKPTTFLHPVIVDLCIDPHLLEGMVRHFKNLCFTQSGQYIDRAQSSYHAVIRRDNYREKANIEPIFAALGMDIFEIQANTSEKVRAACLAIQYGFNGQVFYLQAPCSVQFSDRFKANFMVITEAEYVALLPIELLNE